MEYRIKELIRDRNLSVSDLAEKINIKRESLSRIVNGASTSVETLQSIADVLKVNITELFESTPKGDLIGIVRYNDKPYEINSIADIENLLTEIKKEK